MRVIMNDEGWIIADEAGEVGRYLRTNETPPALIVSVNQPNQ